MATTENVGLMRYKDAAGNEYILYPVAKTSGIIADGPLDMDGQKVTNLPTPTEAGDAASKQYADTRAVRNLLDNSDFRNPVNQRGEIHGFREWTYFIDRWRIAGVNNTDAWFTIEDGYIAFDTRDKGELYLSQMIPAEKGIDRFNKDYTFAYYDTDHDKIRVYPANSYLVPLDDGTIRFSIPLKPVVAIGWVALYEGEYTAETLPPYVPKGYGAELAECQRYFFKITGVVRTFKNPAGAAQAGFNIALPIEMRIRPTVSFDEISERTGIDQVTTNSVSGFFLDAVESVSNFCASADL